MVTMAAMHAHARDRARRGLEVSPRPAIPALLVAVALLSGCAGGRSADFVWVQDYAGPGRTGPGYVIGNGDQLSVKVFNQEGMSGKATVREDGMISLPFLNDVHAAGSTPAELATRLQGRLKQFIVNPVVTVSVEAARPTEVSVVGEVKKPGSYQLEPRGGVLQALASAGGLTDFADRDRVFVIRQQVRIRFTYRALTRADPPAVSFLLQTGDVVVVE